MKKMMMKERHSYIIRMALMAASGILLCGIAEAVRPEVDLSVGVPADKVVIADGILDQETQNDTDESFCDRLMKKKLCQTGTGTGGFHTGAGSRIKSGCVPVRGDVQCGERCGSYIK